MAIPEKEDSVYKGLEPSEGPAFVCSSLITAIYKAAGLFGDLEIIPQEVHVRDLYNMNLFEDVEKKRPEICKEADPDIPYCQILGRYRINIPKDELSYIRPYDHMDERCPTVGPEFYRPEGC
mmetsp:Transcript_40586/g.39148  ORF Transcript_40586/g.39148 Transcript_40586/m.39148 type:complete len:122 (+) Transcript_40586:1324-1689(+)